MKETQGIESDKKGNKHEAAVGIFVGACAHTIIDKIELHAAEHHDSGQPTGLSSASLSETGDQADRRALLYLTRLDLTRSS